MIEKVEQLEKSRKKPPPQFTHKQNQLSISTPNLKYHFLVNEPGKVLYELRKTQIDIIIDNLRNYVTYNNTNQEHSLKQKPMKYKKILITAGKPGTGKTSSIKYVLDLIVSQCKKSSKQFKFIQSIRLLEFNANSLRKCNQIKKQLNKLNNQNIQNQSEKIKNTIYYINKQSHIRLNILYIEQIDKFIESNNENDLQQFLEILSNKSSSSQSQTSKQSKIINKYLLIGASNCINIEHMLMKKLPISSLSLSLSSSSSLSPQLSSSSSSIKPQIIIYQPYSQESIIKILSNKIQMVRQKLDINLIIDQKLLRYIGMKLNQNRKDDARTIIQVVKQLLVYAQNKNKQNTVDINRQQIDKYDRNQKNHKDMIDDKTQSTTLLNKYDKYQQKNIQINLEVINKFTKIKDMITNPKLQIIQKLTLKQHLMLLCIYQYMKQFDSIQVPQMQLIQKFRKLHITMGVSSTFQDAETAIRQLQTYDCVQMRNNKNKNINNINNIGKTGNKIKCNIKIALKVSLTDIQKVLSKNTLLGKYFD